MRLWDMQAGTKRIITAIAPDLPEQFRVRLSELGFACGEEIECVRKTPFGGPKVFRVRDSVFSLASDVATAVVVGDEV